MADGPAGGGIEVLDAVIVGAGFGGLYMLHRLRELGLSARVYRGRRRRRRHVVLEPLSGRPLRRREHGVLVPVLRRAPAGVGVDGALRDPARDPRATRTTSPTASTSAATSSFDTRVASRRFDEDADRWRFRRPTHGATRGVGAVPDHGDRVPVVGASMPDYPGHRHVRGRDLPHRPVAARGRRLHRAAGRGDRHRVLRHPVDPDDRRSRRASSTCSSAPPSYSVPAHNAPLDPDDEAAIKADYAAFRSATG